jgi:hypothetical protein
MRIGRRIASSDPALPKRVCLFWVVQKFDDKPIRKREKYVNVFPPVARRAGELTEVG